MAGPYRVRLAGEFDGEDLALDAWVELVAEAVRHRRQSCVRGRIAVWSHRQAQAPTQRAASMSDVWLDGFTGRAVTWGKLDSRRGWSG